ncbi:hypothetical protein HGK51_04805 [Helicobacter pylori]|uniref:Dynamin-like helical domain-containing protein n=1 Tax=Helicobacter pylori TaxID=210 RepID=A0ABD7CDN4_HELPX|nr:hypothetical protein [Helicobacter pylori]QQW66359.1 hypothetical protein HGK49_04960 [Helicobacter pylori]QQW99649.1 hypothetical protein HGK51_04805 [Helicobacter pylori]
MQDFEEIKKRFDRSKTEFSSNVKDKVGEYIVQNYFEPILNSLNHLVRLEQMVRVRCKEAEIRYAEALIIVPSI